MVLPLLGRIAAGRPIEAIETPETISLADFVRSKEVFVLEVRGQSMQDEAILDGDYVLVEKTKTAHNGDIVVALVDGADATLKRFFPRGREHSIAAFECGHEADDLSGGGGGDSGAGDWRAAEVLVLSSQLSVLRKLCAGEKDGLIPVLPNDINSWFPLVRLDGGRGLFECRLWSGSLRVAPLPVRL